MSSPQRGSPVKLIFCRWRTGIPALFLFMPIRVQYKQCRGFCLTVLQLARSRGSLHHTHPGASDQIFRLINRGVITMGKGDKRSFRGKVFKGSYGNTRPRKKGPRAKK